MDKILQFEEICPNLYLLKAPFASIWSGVFLLDGPQRILVDSGASAAGVDEYILPALKALGLTPADIDWLINTHAHGDHAGGNGRVLELSGAKLAAYVDAVDKMENPLVYNRATRATYPGYSPAPAVSLPAYHPDLVLRDGDILAERLQVFHAPGHDTECVVMVDCKNHAVLTGDSIQAFGVTGSDGAGVGFYKDLSGYLQTIRKVESLDVDYLFASHDFKPFGYSAVGKEEVARYLQICRAATEIYDYHVCRMVKAGVTDVAAIAAALLEQLGVSQPPYLFMTMYTVEEHIKAYRERT